MRVMSGSGSPFAPIFHGVWQSLQPDVLTMYSPRCAGVWTGAGGGVGVELQAAARMMAAATEGSRVNARIEGLHGGPQCPAERSIICLCPAPGNNPVSFGVC